MTLVAFQRGLNVGWSFTLRNHVIVATGTETQYFVVIHGAVSNRNPRRRTWLVTGITYIGGINMISALARRYRSVMTTDTSANHLRVINIGCSHRCPWRRSRLMTGIARIGGINMVRTLARRHNAIMTTDTGTDYLGMIDVNYRHRSPWDWTCGMTRIALVGRVDM